MSKRFLLFKYFEPLGRDHIYEYFLKTILTGLSWIPESEITCFGYSNVVAAPTEIIKRNIYETVPGAIEDHLPLSPERILRTS